MKISPLRYIGIAGSFAALCSLLPTGGSAQTSAAPDKQPPVRFTLVELGGVGSNEIDDPGHVVGLKQFEAGGVRRAALWPSIHSAPLDLGTLPGLGSIALSLNPKGEIVGKAFDPDGNFEEAIYWARADKKPMALAGVPAGYFSHANAINERGQIVGDIYNSDATYQGVFWRSGRAPAVILRTNGDLSFSQAVSINAAGRIFGNVCSTETVACYACLWPDSSKDPILLASPAGEFIYTGVQDLGTAGGINNAGNMVGVAINADYSQYRAVYWAHTSSPAVILRTPDDLPQSWAQSISENGHIVGLGLDDTFSVYRPLYWADSTSQAIDLSQFFPSDWYRDYLFVYSVNNRGEVTGFGLKGPVVSNFVLVPVHGPGDKAVP